MFRWCRETVFPFNFPVSFTFSNVPQQKLTTVDRNVQLNDLSNYLHSSHHLFSVTVKLVLNRLEALLTGLKQKQLASSQANSSGQLE